MCIDGLFSKLKRLQAYKIIKIAIFYLFQKKKKKLTDFYLILFFFFEIITTQIDAGSDGNFFDFFLFFHQLTIKNFNAMHFSF